MLVEVRWHGRGGQGVVTSSELLARAALHVGYYVYHAPEFGPERRGAPVRAYTRISDEPIEQHFGIYEPDVVVIIDPTLQSEVDYILQGLKKNGTLVLNAVKPLDEVVKAASKLNASIYHVDAYTIAMEVFRRPFYNTPMLGAMAKASGIVPLDALMKALEERFSGEVLEKNKYVVKLAYEKVKKYE